MGYMGTKFGSPYQVYIIPVNFSRNQIFKNYTERHSIL